MKKGLLFTRVHPYLSAAVLIWAGVMTLILVAVTRDFYDKQTGDLYLFSGNDPQYTQESATTAHQQMPDTPAASRARQ